MRRLCRTSGTRGSTRRRDAGHVEVQQNRFTRDPRERHVDIVWQPCNAVAIDSSIWNMLQNAVEQPIAQCRHTCNAHVTLVGGKFQCGRHADDTRNVLRTASTRVLLATSMLLPGDLYSATHVEKSYPFRSV